MDTYVGDLITDVRNDTRNGDIEAFSDSEILRYLQYAQNYLFSKITKLPNVHVFIESQDLDIVANQKSYAITDNLSYGTRITGVFYSHDRTEQAFRRLKPSTYRPGKIFYAGRPLEYIREHGKIVLQPIPDVAQGLIRVLYERAMDRLSLRTARISAMPTTADITIALDDQTEFRSGKESEVEARFLPKKYFCVNDFDGNVMLYNGQISSYDAPTNKFILSPLDLNEKLADGYTLNDVADNGYITLGKYTTTHSDFPEETAQYLVEWATRKLHGTDSSDQWRESDRLLQEMEDAIMASYRSPDKDPKPFPIEDRRMLIARYD